MDIPRLSAFNKYWERTPPVHQSVAVYLGIKPKREARLPSTVVDEATDYIGDFLADETIQTATDDAHQSRPNDHIDQLME